MMTRALLAVAGATAALLASLVDCNRRLRQEVSRLTANNRALTDSTIYYRTASGHSAASVEQLTLTVAELRKQYAEVVDAARDVDVKPRRIVSASTMATRTRVRVTDDSCKVVPDSLQVNVAIAYRDPWVDVVADNTGVDITVRDTLRQIVHRVPRRFWFIRWGTKAIRQEVISSNPHTDIVYTEYITLR